MRNRITCYRNHLTLILLTTTIFLTGSLNHASAEETSKKKTTPIGKKIAEFQLKDFRGKTHRLSDHKKSEVIVVAFLGTECPLAKLYTTRLVELAKKNANRKVTLIAIDSNVQDSITEIGHYVRTHKITFPVLKDVGNKVADQFTAERTPEVFVLDSKRTVRYWGAIDDQYGIGIIRPEVTRAYVQDAIDALLAGKKVTQPIVPAVGCHIGRVRKPDTNSKVTYSNQISRIFQRRCIECHREGDIAPFALTDYDEVAGWAEMIQEVVQQQRMPPWHANPKHGNFMNDARLTDKEKDLIYQWVKAGAPLGDRKQLPPPRKFTKGWRIPKPDKIVYMRNKPFHVKAEGEVKYQYYEVDPGFKEDKWIQAAECQPGNRAVVHHIIVFVRPPGAKSGTIRSEWLAAMAPGSGVMKLPVGLAKYVPAGSKLIFQVHYTPNGSPQTDRSRIGLVFADPKKVRKEVGTWRAVKRNFSIPPDAENHKVTASYTFRKDMQLLALFPHMHLRGKSFRYEAIYPNGKKEILLDVPQYDFNWQNSYNFAKPKRMPVGTKLFCTAHFDNSAENLANPDPTKRVSWGDQTWDEMMIGYFSMVLTKQDLTKDKPIRRTQRFLTRIKKNGQLQIDQSMKTLAAAALNDAKSFNKFAEQLRIVVPQLDRVCLSVVKSDGLLIKRVFHSPELPNSTGAGVLFPKQNMALTEHAQGKKTVIHPAIAKVKGNDMQFMRRIVSSSMHVPMVIGKNPSTLNFWSTETDAFPKEATEYLQQVVKFIK